MSKKTTKSDVKVNTSTKEVKSKKKTSVKKEVEETKKEDVVTLSKKDKRDKSKKKAIRKKFSVALVISLIILIVSGSLLYPMLTNTKFGLDLQGGFEILYRVENPDGSAADKSAVESTYRTILKRIDILGVSEPEITIEDKNIRIQLAGVTDKEEAKQTLSSMARLSFATTDNKEVMTADVLKPNRARVQNNPDVPGQYIISLEVKDTDKFYEETEKIRKSDNPIMVTWLDFDPEVDKYEEGKCGALGDSKCISAAQIINPLTTSDIMITGDFSYDEAKSLADLINSGSLDTKLVELSSKTVDASFGDDALRNTFIAGIIAVTLIILYMIYIYRFSGFIASIGIITYTMLIFMVFNLVGGRLTLPSIAAVVIGIGMAVDATVLSFERIKDELRDKNNLDHAFKQGNKGSLVSIIDANITTLIAAVILFIFGESSVKGFATMLIISIAVTMLVMVYLVRFLLRKFVNSNMFEDHPKAFIGLKSLDNKPYVTKLNYVKHNFKFAMLSLLIICGGMIYLYFNGLNLSIDFKGGSSITLIAEDKLDTKVVSKELKELGYEVENIDALEDNQVYATLNNTLESKDNEKIEKYFSEHYKKATASIGSVSPEVKKALVRNAIMALIYAAIGIIIYVSLRFTLRYGISAIITLLHDALIVVVLFTIFKLEVSSIFIAAILSIIGYSINDTIVIFDHIRENRKNVFHGKINTYKELKELVNMSVKGTVVRSIVTSITTIIPVVCLLILGSHEINTFNYALLIGLVAGTYSSIFIAPYLWMLLEKKHVGKEEKKKWYEVDDKDEVEELKIKGINC